MRKRKTKRRHSKIWTWISFLVFAVIISILAGALITRQTPAAFLSKLFTHKKQDSDYTDRSKKDLILLLESRDSIVTRMAGELNLMRKRCGLGLATVIVDNEALNMRTEPSINAEIKTRIPNGSSVVVLEYADEEVFLNGQKGQWVFIEFSGDRGWAWGNYLTVRD